MNEGLNGVWKTVLPLAVMVLAMGGCGGGADTAQVSGTVTIDGNPLADAAVAFTGPEGGQMVSAMTDASGNFTIEAPLGENLVAVSKAAAGGAADAGDGLMPADGSVPPPKSEIPEKYANPQKSGLSVDVASGMAPVKLELTSN